jgi:hypothetical protein
MRREARLRPEFAHLYPMLQPGVWVSAAEIAEKIATARLLELADCFVLHDRVLTDAHFEFRGGSPRREVGGPGKPDAEERRDAGIDAVL